MNLKIIILAAMLAAFGLPLQGQSKNRTSPSDAPPSTVAKEHRAEVSIPDTRRFTVVSKLSGRAYQIDVALPQAPQPNGGYPVIYVLDGNWYFASVVEAVRREKPETVVVGVGYPLGSRTWTRNALSKYQSLPASIDSSAWAVNFARLYDLTPPQDDESLKNENLFCGNNQICTHDSVGGVDDFLKIIETEVKPKVYAVVEATHAHVDRENEILFGHSLGGLAVIEALFVEPKAFRTFISASPSIGFASHEVLLKETGFNEQVKSGKVSPRILITVGAEEQAIVISDACQLASRLKTLHGSADYEAPDCAIFADQTHGIAPWPAIGRAVSFAFADSQIMLDPALLAAYTGRYEFTPDFVLSVKPSPGGLTVQATGQPPFDAVATRRDEFSLLAIGAQLKFKRDTSNAIQSVVLHQGGNDSVGKKLP